MSKDLISKQVRSLRCHAAVKWSKPKGCHWETGKARIARKLSQKNCLRKKRPKYAASDRRMVKYKCAFLSLCRRAFFLAGIRNAYNKRLKNYKPLIYGVDLSKVELAEEND